MPDATHEGPNTRQELPAILKRIVCIGGFTQRRHGRVGIEKVWHHLRCAHEQPVNGCCVTIHPWNDDWRQFVGHVLRTGPRNPLTLDVRIVAYSWGVGYGAIRLAELLRAEGVQVRNLISCDGVWHSRWMPWRAILSPLLGPPRIVVPSNVLQVDYLKQTNRLPCGHEIVSEVPHLQSVRFHGDEPGVTHQDIDDSERFLSLALEHCR